jgi:hypothetical protein
MTVSVDLLLQGVLIGPGGAALMDVWSLALRRGFGIPTLHYARGEGKGELDAAHRVARELTARTYPAGGTGSRCGSDQRAVMREE